MSGQPAKRGASGEHPSVKAYRAKLDSIGEIAAPGGKLHTLGTRIDAQLAKLKSDRPAKDPRREDDTEIPVDVVDVRALQDDTPTLRVLPEAPGSEDDTTTEPDPFPSPRSKRNK